MGLELERQGAVAIMTIDRPEARNAINSAMSRAIEAALDELEADESIRVVILTATGKKVFCAGADLKAFATEGAEGIATERGGFAGMVKRRFAKPIIAAVNGHAFAGGFEIVLACDLVVAVEQAQFGLPEVRRALFAGGGGTIRLPKRIGLNAALEIILTGDPFTAERAYGFGLVNRLVSSDDLMNSALELAEDIARNPPFAIALAKKLARDSLELTEAEAWIINDEQSDIIIQSKDAIEGARAFAEKREPDWKS